MNVLAAIDTPKKGRGRPPREVPPAVDLLLLPGLVPTGVIVGPRTTVAAEALTCGIAPVIDATCRVGRIKDRRRVVLRDLPLWANPLDLRVSFVRCACIHGNIRPALPAPLSRAWRCTLRLGEQMALEVLNAPLAKVAERNGLSRRWLRQLFVQVTAKLRAEYRPHAGKVVGIDEAHIYGRRPAVITNLRRGKVIALLPRNSEVSVAGLLANLVGADRVEAVVIDMHHPYRRAIQASLPQAKIVIDRRHVLELVRRKLIHLRNAYGARLPMQLSRQTASGARRERVATLLSRRWARMGHRPRCQLERIFAVAPALRDAYWFKEFFFEMYTCTSRAMAEASYDAWSGALSPAFAKRFASVLRTVDQWRPYIFNYFDIEGRRTAGFTEASNRRLKEISSEGRGNTHHRALEIKALHRLGPITAEQVRAAARWVMTNAKPGGSHVTD